MATLNEFSIRISRRAKRIEENTDKLVKRTAALVDQTVVVATPVLTGRARSNWIAAVGKPSRATQAPYAPYSPQSSPGMADTANTAAAVAAARSTINRRQEGQTIYISNNLDYIGLLNSPETPSAKAPPYFVQEAVDAATREIRKARIVDK